MSSSTFCAIVLLLAANLTASGQTTRAVRLTSADDVGIIGTYYPVAEKSASNPRTPAVLLIHSLGKNRDEWAEFAPLLQRNGIAALAIDLRGHGDSTRQLTARGPQTLELKSFTPRDFQDMLLDVNAAVDWLLERLEIDTNRIAIVGSSLGANIAVRYVSFNEDIAALGLLSPGIVYRDLRTDDAIRKMGAVPLRMFVSRYDGFAFESCNRLSQIRKETGAALDDRELVVSTGNLHGAEMLKGVHTLPQLLVDWLRQVLLGIAPEPATPSPAPPAAPAPTPKRRK